MTGLRNSSAQRRICAIPRSFPLVHTLVARKTRGRNPGSATRSPVTASARPYIGEVSIIRPPASTSCRSTALSGARAPSSAPTSKTCEVPSPMTGIASPEDGIGRVIIGPAAMAFILASSGTIAAPANPRKRSRRDVLNLAVIASTAKQSRATNALAARLLRRLASRNDSLCGRSPVEPQHQLQVLHRRARGAFAEIVEPRHQHRLTPRLVGVDAELEPVGVVERLGFELAAGDRLDNPHVVAAAICLRQDRIQITACRLSRQGVEMQWHGYQHALPEMPDRGHEDRPPGEAGVKLRSE